MRVAAGEAELARARILALAPEGFEEVEAGGALELVAYTSDLGVERIRAVFGSVDVARVEPGWENRWRAFHRPVRVGGLWIGPPWDTPPRGVPAVVIEPGRAFGTGAHASTRACLELLSRVERGSLVDAGCGSGVLAVAAARLGFSPVTALDVDVDAVEAARENAGRNGVEIDIRPADVLVDDLPPADLLVANIELAVVETLLARWAGARAITSGYLANETPAAPGWVREERVELEGWAADQWLRTV